MRMNKIKVLIAAAALSLTLGCGASFETNLNHMRKNTTVKRYNIEQVFRDHDGYRVYHKDNDGRLVEEKYYSSRWRDRQNPLEYYRSMPEHKKDFKSLNIEAELHDGRLVQVYKDLKAGEEPYVMVLETWTNCSAWDGELNPNGSQPVLLQYAEIHLPQDENISAGNEVYGGKYKTTSPMGEIK